MKIVLFIILFSSTIFNYSQQIKPGSPIVGSWQLVSPRKSPGPEFVADTYIGIGAFKLASGSNISVAASKFDESTQQYVNAAEFIAEWNEKQLTGIVSISNWPKVSDPLKINVPLEYNAKKDQITIHINNPEYGDVKFIYKRTIRN